MQLPSECLPTSAFMADTKPTEISSRPLLSTYPSALLCSASPSSSVPTFSSSNSQRTSAADTARDGGCGNASSSEGSSKSSCSTTSSVSENSDSMKKVPPGSDTETASSTADITKREGSNNSSKVDNCSSPSSSSSAEPSDNCSCSYSSGGGSSNPNCENSSNIKCDSSSTSSELARGGDSASRSGSCDISSIGRSTGNSSSNGQASEIALEEVEDVLATPLESAAAERVRQFLISEKVSGCRLIKVQKNYYSLTLEQRRLLLGAPSVCHLCKTVVVENTRHTGVDEKINSRYYMVILPYPRRLNGERVKDVIKALNAKNNVKLGNKKLNFNFCKEGVQLTGFQYNAITPLGSLLPVPVVLDSEAAALQPPVIWLGGGEENMKVMLPLSELQRVFDPIVGRVTFEEEE